MSSRQEQTSWIKRNTFKHDEQLLSKASQITLQIVPPAGNTFHLLGQIFLVLLQASRFLIGFVKGSFQVGVFFLQFADRSQLLFSERGFLISFFLRGRQILILFRQSLVQFL